jgi:hypothetical protein
MALPLNLADLKLRAGRLQPNRRQTFVRTRKALSRYSLLSEADIEIGKAFSLTVRLKPATEVETSPHPLHSP